MTAPVLAAGAVCWKVTSKGNLKILVVHRTQHRDISLPKGKVDPGETLPETAVREIAEETGLIIGLGPPLGVVEYMLPNGRDKVVYYWSAEVSPLAIANSTFASNDEIESLTWMRNGQGLLMTAGDVSAPFEPAQIWFVPYPGGGARRVTKRVRLAEL